MIVLTVIATLCSGTAQTSWNMRRDCQIKMIQCYEAQAKETKYVNTPAIIEYDQGVIAKCFVRLRESL